MGQIYRKGEYMGYATGNSDNKLVYISSSSTNYDIISLDSARRYCYYVLRSGAVPFSPHLYFPQFLNTSDPADRKKIVNYGLVVLSECDELWAFGNLINETMRLELQIANNLAIPMRFFNDACEGVNNNHAADI